MKKAKDKQRPIRFHKIYKFMRKLVRKYSNYNFPKKGKKKLHLFFHRKDKTYNPLEKLFYSEKIYSKKGCHEFIGLLNRLKEKGFKKQTKKTLSKQEKETIDKEIKKMKILLKQFEKNPDKKSPYIRDRYLAENF